MGASRDFRPEVLEVYVRGRIGQEDWRGGVEEDRSTKRGERRGVRMLGGGLDGTALWRRYACLRESKNRAFERREKIGSRNDASPL